ncbi:MAG: asparagine synthase (glutamine-hydrolyzing), partial [Betaproteobacteria bacterium]|nr:asparagine synthase (glutamine-hydrolyzing) [Betaproteobacteria bacterium]
MCGILGLVDTPWQASAEAALEPLRTRGPDANGFWRGPEVILGHTRLSVIDLAGGAQPMVSSHGRHVIVYNGEIYNFQALRSELEAGGERFATRSDTEVILRGYAVWGREVVSRLDGIFAFAIWDANERKVFAARDRLGVKPLFYSAQSGLVFASTLAPFLRLRGFPRGLDYEALRDYLAFQAPLAPASFLAAVRQLEPAHWLEWQDGRLRTERYWSIPRPVERETASDPLPELDALLASSVRSQLVSDVPLGAFLSGGIDSSLIVHYMAQAQASPLATFSVRFAEQGYDESPAALAVARRYATEHHVLEAPQIGADALAEALGALDQPLADPAYVPTYVLSRLARRQVTVALSGDGGDELFGGYARFLDTEDANPDHAGKRLLRALIRSGLAPGALLRRSLAGQDLLLYRRTELGPWPVSRKSLARYLQADALAQAKPADTLGLWRRLATSFGGRMDSAALMRADLWTYLSENCLVKTDRASMAHGLEVRVPLLGNAVVDYALARPAQSHLSPQPKALLRALAHEKLPEEVWGRPKHG